MDNSPLGGLSAELRNMISEFALIDTKPINLRHVHNSNGLTQTCRQMRREAHIMFWASNTFDYYLEYFSAAKGPERALAALGIDTLSQIKSMTFRSLHGASGGHHLRMNVYGFESGKIEKAKAKGQHFGSWAKLPEGWRSSGWGFDPVIEIFKNMGFSLRLPHCYGRGKKLVLVKRRARKTVPGSQE